LDTLFHLNKGFLSNYVAGGDKYHVVNYTTDETEKDDEQKDMIVVKS
jgi:hypothetical protein